MPDNPYGLSDSEMRQIDALAAAANRPNINLMAGMVAGDPGVANLASQIQAQQTRGAQQRLGRLESAMQARAQARDVTARQTALQEARFAEQRRAAGAAREQQLEDIRRQREWDVSDMALEQANKLELQRLKNEGKLSQAKKAADRMARQQAAARVSWAKTQQPKALSGTQEEKLSTAVRNLLAVQRVEATFDPAFLDTVGVIGELQNRAAREFGPLVPQEWRDQANWWRDYQKHLSLPERHEFFGATLTQGEQRAWKQAEVGPGMTADDMRTNLKKRAQILKEAVARKARSIAISRRNPAAVRELLGDLDIALPTQEETQEPFPAEIFQAGVEGARPLEDYTDEELEALAEQAGL